MVRTAVQGSINGCELDTIWNGGSPSLVRIIGEAAWKLAKFVYKSEFKVEGLRHTNHVIPCTAIYHLEVAIINRPGAVIPRIWFDPYLLNYFYKITHNKLLYRTHFPQKPARSYIYELP